MRPFAFSAPTDPAAAVGAAAGHPGTRFVAGGTTLLDLMKLEVETPDRLVDINRLAEGDPSLAAIEELPGGGLRIGALTRNSDVAWHEAVRSRYPVLSQALLSGASGQIRNMATTGGNLLQRTRCWYFRDVASPCNKREPGSGCAALEGRNRIHAVLGTSRSCIATHPSDMAVALAALGATVRVRGHGSDRAIPIVDFYRLPDDHPARETRLDQGELITAVDVPPLPFARRSCYVKVRDRASFAFALASAAVALDMEDGVVREARVALGGVATRPWRTLDAESVLEGRQASPEAWREAADAALKGARAVEENGFKIPLAKRTLERALAAAAALEVEA